MNMKVLIVNKFLYPNGGSETYIFKTGEELQKKGHEVQYFGMEHTNRIVGNHAECYTTNMDFHTNKLTKVLYPFKIIYSAEARKKMGIVLRDFRPDVVHLNNFNFQLTPSILYEIRKYEREEKKKVKIIYTAHDSQLVCPDHLMQQYLTQERCDRCVTGSPWNCAKNKCIHGSLCKSIIGSLEAWIYRTLKAYRMIDVIICPSDFLKKQLDHCREIAGKTLVMHNFIDIPDGEAEKKDERKYVLYFGRYSKEKGMETLLQVCQELPEIPFVFAGNGPLEEKVNHVDNIENKGFQSGEKLYSLIRNAQFMIFPSECNENCPFSVMESIAEGIPVIGSDIGGVPELISDGQNGFLVAPGNAEELKSKISCLWNDDDKLKSMKNNCKNTKYDSLSEYCDKLVELYQK